MDITKHPTFTKHDGQLICQLIGGSTLYGLNTVESDIDYRGLFVAHSPLHISGLSTIDNIVTESPHDATYYEIGRYMELLRKTNTQVLEILFAPKESFIYSHPYFEVVRENRYSLIDSEKLKNSLKGYVFSEMRLATGERSGRLGGKRKEKVSQLGFSPKNFVQIMRLCVVGSHFYNTGEYMVNVKSHSDDLYKQLMDIKINPSNYSCEELKDMVYQQYAELIDAIEHSNIQFNFDERLAASLILEARGIR
jgi:hypothetical protein